MKFYDYSDEVKKALEEASIAFLHEACGEVEGQAKNNSAVVTGKTKGSYENRVDESKMEGYVGSNYENAIWEEFGTGEYALNGDGRKGGWFYVDEKGKGHFTHGKKPKRPLLKAYTFLKGSLESMAKETFGGIK